LIEVEVEIGVVTEIRIGIGIEIQIERYTGAHNRLQGLTGYCKSLSLRGLVGLIGHIMVL
jgi:hypothetical protein